MPDSNQLFLLWSFLTLYLTCMWLDNFQSKHLLYMYGRYYGPKALYASYCQDCESMLASHTCCTFFKAIVADCYFSKPGWLLKYFLSPLWLCFMNFLSHCGCLFVVFVYYLFLCCLLAHEF